MNTIEIPSKPNDESIKLLLRAKMVLSHAVEHGSKTSEFDNALAILGLDNCIEYILRIIAIHFELEALTGKSFEIPDLPSLAGEVYKAIKVGTGINLPYLAEIKLIRQTRNLVQHGMVSPKADIDRFIKITERFFDSVLIHLFGLTKQELKLSVVAEDSLVKVFFQKAENHIDKKDWLPSIIASRDAFENAYYNHIKDASVPLSLYPAIVYERKNDNLSNFSWDVVKDELLLNYLGINSPEYRRFKEFIRHIPDEFCVPDSFFGNFIMQREWNREDALFCYSFSINTVLMWQIREKERIYIPKFENSIEFIEKIGTISLSKETEDGCIYTGSDTNDSMNLYYGKRTLIEKLKKLKVNNIYNFKRILITNGKKETPYEAKIRFLGFHNFLLVNNPEKWGIILWYKLIDEK